MSLGGEAILGEMTKRERYLLDEAWVWRAVQVLAKDGTVSISLGHGMETIIITGARVYHLDADTQALLDDARAAQKAVKDE